MKVYLAAAYKRREEVLRYAKLIDALGHRVVSTWLHGKDETHDTGEGLPDPAIATDSACEDVTDVIAADMVISFTEPRGGSFRGGRHVEFGIGVALNKRLWLVGSPEHIFHMLPNVHVFRNVCDMMAELIRETRHAEQGPGAEHLW